MQLHTEERRLFIEQLIKYLEGERIEMLGGTENTNTYITEQIDVYYYEASQLFEYNEMSGAGRDFHFWYYIRTKLKNHRDLTEAFATGQSTKDDYEEGMEFLVASIKKDHIDLLTEQA